MGDSTSNWIEFMSQDGRRGRVRADQIDMVSRSSGGESGTIHTSLGELIRVLNVTHILKQWRHRLLFIVSREAGEHYRYLQRAFADVEWAEVLFDRRQGDRRRQQCQWMVDRRNGCRRARRDIDERLRGFGWAVVRVNRVETEGYLRAG